MGEINQGGTPWSQWILGSGFEELLLPDILRRHFCKENPNCIATPRSCMIFRFQKKLVSTKVLEFSLKWLSNVVDLTHLKINRETPFNIQFCTVNSEYSVKAHFSSFTSVILTNWGEEINYWVNIFCLVNQGELKSIVSTNKSIDLRVCPWKNSPMSAPNAYTHHSNQSHL